MRKFNLILILTLFLISCTKTVILDLPPYQPRIVVNGLISDNDSARVQVSRSISSADTNTMPFIINAVVRILDENGNLFEQLTYRPFLGKYVGTKPVLRGARYSISVKVGDDEATASTRISENAKLDFFTYAENVSIDSSGFPVGEVSFGFTDLISQDNFYRLNMHYFDELTQTFKVLNLADDEFIDAQAELTTGGQLFNDRTFRGKQQRISLPVPFGLVSKTAPYLFRVSLEVLNDDYTKYEISRRLYNNSNGLLANEPVEIFSNIKNGIGIFGGSALARDTLKN